MENYDFSGWATKNNLQCSDGRIIRKDAFKHHDGQTVPLVWNHDHKDPYRVLGHALLKNCEDGVMAYCKFNDTDLAKTAKIYVEHGDVTQLSIYANQLKQQGPNVMHGMIREVSLVLAGANPGAVIENVLKHSADSDEFVELDDEVKIRIGDDYANLSLYHADESEETEEEVVEETEEVETETETETEAEAEEVETENEEDETDEDLEHADDEDDDDDEEVDEETIEEVLKSFNDKQEKVFFALIGKALKEGAAQKENKDNSEGGNNEMKQNVFDQQGEVIKSNTLSHADQEAIIELAKSKGSLKAAIAEYAANNKDTLAHGTWENVGELFPDYKDVHPGAPELIERDMGWVGSVMKKARKSPISRVRTRQADGRATALRAKGYNDREIEKRVGGSLKLYMRTTDPTTVYVRDTLHRDDVNDITDFDAIAYQKTVMRHNMEETIALAALVGDLREDTDPDKIDETKIRPIWKDDELYTIHYDIDFEAAKNELQGSNTSANFGENYIRSEALVAASLYAGEKYKGKGAKTMYIDPHELNVMLLARDLNGRRIYDSTSDLAKAFNVDEILTVEQFSGLTRKTKDGKTKKLLCLIVNMANYQFGSTKGGELTSFDDFDIKFNLYEYLMETRVSGALTEIFSAIAIEEDVTEEAAG